MTRVGVYLWQNMTMLDVFGPHQMLGLTPGIEMVTVARSTDPVVTDTGIRVLPDHDLRSCGDVDILLTGGGSDPSRELADDEVLSWFRKTGEGAQWVTSVCTGALILAEAGLLDGYRATTHWACLPELASYPEITVVPDERIVRDRNRITAGGVTAGIDFAFALIAELVGAETAAALQLLAEYDPQPLTPYGHPRTAPAELVAAVSQIWAPMRTDLDAFYAARAAG